MIKIEILLAILLVVLIMGAGEGECEIENETAETSQNTKSASIQTGTHRVGTDVEPGTYKGQAGQDIWEACYWARLSGLSGELSDIIANENATGQFYVTISSTDVAFETTCNLELITAKETTVETAETSQNTKSASIQTGTHRVGIDIEPGTYKGQAGQDIWETCYWARLSGLSGELSDIIANENATGQFYVTISSTDVAFETTCKMERVK